MGKNRIGLKILYVCIGIVITAMIIFGLVKLGYHSYQFSYDVFNERAVSASPGKDVVVTINDGMSAYQVGKVMEEKGLTDNQWLFLFQMKMSDYGKMVKPGTYQLNSSMPPTEIMKVLARVTEEPKE